jgi:hypothetical protein
MKKTTRNNTATPIFHVNENASLEEQIAERAHELWQQRGGAHGDDLTDWFRAEQEIKDWHHRRRSQTPGNAKPTST